MRRYDLSQAAADDLREIARYTLRRWGAAQVRFYRDALEKAFNDIAAGTAPSRQFSEQLPELRVLKKEHHFIFYVWRERPLIIAVLHERRDMSAELAERLDGE